MLKSSQLSLLEEVEKRKLKEKIEEIGDEDFEKEMDKISKLPEEEWLKMFEGTK